MKFFKSTILAMLGLAVSLTACSDDDNYTQGIQSPGAYFADDAPEVVAIPQTGSQFDVTVYRTDAEASCKYDLESTDPSGLFTIPTEVHFEEGKLTTTITITFDENDIVIDQQYPITLTIKGATVYGPATYSFMATRPTPLETEVFGTGIWYLTGFWSGTYSGLELYKTFNPSQPNEITFTIETNPGGLPIEIYCPDYSNLVDGKTEIYIKPQYTGYDHDTYGPVWVADMYSYWNDYAHDPEEAQLYKGKSYYEPERGLFTFDIVYYVPEYGTGSSWFGEATEYFQLYGYPDLSIEVSYSGTMIKPNNSYAAIAHVVPGEDVAKSKAAMVPGKDADAAVEAVLNDAAGVQEFNGADEYNVEFVLEEGGVYTIAAVSFDETGEVGETASVTFEVIIGANPYEPVGDAIFVDGWILPGFGVDVMNYAWNVPLMVSTSNSSVFALDSPWTQEMCPLENDNSLAYRVVIDASNKNCVLMQPQESGYASATNFGGMVEISNFEGYVASLYPDMTISEVMAFTMSKGKALSTYEDGIMTFKTALFSDSGKFGYSWNNPQTGYVITPAAQAPAKRGLLGKLAVKPARQGMLKVVKDHNNKTHVFDGIYVKPIKAVTATSKRR